MDHEALYRDIAQRTDGEIYIGVVGPVRTGKSAFIKQFMEKMVLPNIVGEHRRLRAMEELPVSGAGRTIMTTQPKFVPGTAVEVKLSGGAQAQVRLVDCVGYLIDEALGAQEGEEERMVRTPWFEHDIPFAQAAETSTRRVIEDHSTLGLVVTSDGSVTDIPRSSYIAAEERVIRELRELGKPFCVLLNSAHPDAQETRALAQSLSEEYGVSVESVNVTDLTEAEIGGILENLLLEFPLSEVRIRLPGWIRALSEDHPLYSAVLSAARQAASGMRRMRDHTLISQAFGAQNGIGEAAAAAVRLNDGTVEYQFTPRDGLFTEILSQVTGETISGEEELMTLLTQMARSKKEYDRVLSALEQVRATGYGMVAPDMAEMTLETPEIVRQGGRFGVRLKAAAPSIHMIRVDIQTEVSPIVGTEKQSEELVKYLLSEFENDPVQIWSTNIFGKSLHELVREGVAAKLSHMPDEVRVKIQQTLSRIINEGNGGVICILL